MHTPEEPPDPSKLWTPHMLLDRCRDVLQRGEIHSRTDSGVPSCEGPFMVTSKPPFEASSYSPLHHTHATGACLLLDRRYGVVFRRRCLFRANRNGNGNGNVSQPEPSALEKKLLRKRQRQELSDAIAGEMDTHGVVEEQDGEEGAAESKTASFKKKKNRARDGQNATEAAASAAPAAPPAPAAGRKKPKKGNGVQVVAGAASPSPAASAAAAAAAVARAKAKA